MKSLGDRIKKYEAAYQQTLTPRSCLFIRVDGRAFHTYTKGLARPFDRGLMNAMVETAVDVARDMMGFKLAYVQSDEATFMLTDFDTHGTEGWFGYELNKVVSLSASLFTAHFNTPCRSPRPDKAPATFDSRAFIVPHDDAPNVFIWRQQDWTRNSLQMLARAHFSHKQCHGKHTGQLHDMLMLEKGINWADLTPREKNGTFITRDKLTLSERLDYDTINELLAVPS